MNTWLGGLGAWGGEGFINTKEGGWWRLSCFEGRFAQWVLREVCGGGKKENSLEVSVGFRFTAQTAPLQAAVASGDKGVWAEIKSRRDDLASKWCPVLLSLLINHGFQECCSVHLG